MDFWEIYDQFYQPLKAFIGKMVGDEWAAEDLTQEALIKVQKRLNSLRDESKLKPWIYRIARNQCLDYFRQQAARHQADATDDTVDIAIKPTAQFKLEQHQMSACVQDKLQLLSEPMRAVLVLADTIELSYREIAQILDISVGNVKVRVHRARKAMQEILERECTFEHDERNVMVCEPKEIN